jgi:hypothetical protein
MSRSRLLHRFGLPPSRSRVTKAHRRLSPGRNCTAASGPTFPLLPTKPNGKPTAMMTLRQLLCENAQEGLDTPSSRLPDTTPPTFSLVHGQSRTTGKPLTPHAQQSLDDRPVGCGLYELQRPGFVSAGLFVGTLAPNRRPACRKALILLGFDALAKEAADVKLDFQQMKMVVKHIPKAPVYWAFRNLNMSPINVKTMASPSNHCACGEGCGEAYNLETEVSYG